MVRLFFLNDIKSIDVGREYIQDNKDINFNFINIMMIKRK